jgi:hypothetical protein
MAISSQTLEEILQMTEAFKAQLYDTLHDLADDLKDIFVVFKIHWIACRRYFLWWTSRMNIIKKYMFGMILRLIVMISIWIVVIYGMTITSIFYLMTLLHLL